MQGEVHTLAEATQAGRDIVNIVLWSEKIIEIQPDLVNGGGTIVWEWNVWDHLIQDHDSSKNNFGVVANNPQLIDINYTTNPNDRDWLHFNSIDYNPTLDQIILSVQRWSEIWIIDHSTTTLEASGATGGNSGKGGDLLYRWGNPQTYDQGTANDQKLFKQHDANWIDPNYPDGDKIMIFNNLGGNLGGTNYSTVNIINPPVDGNGHYLYLGGAFVPINFDWTYQAPVPTDFFSSILSGARRLPNGNTLICEGQKGRFFRS